MIGGKSELRCCHKHETDIGATWPGVPWSTALHVSQTHTKGIKSIVV